MTRRSFSRFLAGLSAAFLMTGIAGQAQAASYAYSVQQLSGYSFSGATIGALTSGGNNSAIQVGNPNGNQQFQSNSQGVANDTQQAYVGPAPAPPENQFAPRGQVGPDYIRSDSLTTAGPFTTNTVAEGFLGGSVAGTSIGQSSTSVSAPITVTGTVGNAVTLNFTATNQLVAALTGPLPASAQASFAFTFSITNSAGVVVFSSSPTLVNQSISQNVVGTTTVTNTAVASGPLTSGVLAPGTYTASITQTSRVFLTQSAAIPEPSSLLMGGMAFGLLGGVFGWRHRKSSRTA